MLRLFLFGAPRVELNGQAVPLRRTKALALLAYLAVTRQPQDRDTLLALLWPEFDQASARNNLRRELSLLKTTLGEEALVADRLQVGWNERQPGWIDVALFQQQIAAWKQHGHPAGALCPACAAALATAAELYTDAFLAGFGLPESRAFDEWQFFLREELQQQLAAALAALVSWQQASGASNTALEYARRWVALDPLHEPAQRELMRLYAAAGQHAAALRQYEACARLLEAELGAEPERETAELAEAIRARRLGPPPATDSAGAPAPARPAEASPARPSHLPRAAGFVGRQRELADLLRRLTDPDCRLLTLVGPGGIGKTSLALRAAQLWDKEWAGEEGRSDGVLFVPLVAVETLSGLLSALASAAGLQFYDKPPQEQILDYFRDRRMLLVLDNLEPLLDTAEFLSRLLAAAPGLRLLVTSRAALSLREEWYHPIAGLSFPSGDADISDVGQLARYDAVRLFEQHARRVRSDFSLSRERALVVRLCQMVEGMPLAIELAAAWLKVLSVGQVVAALERGLDILTTHDRAIPERHRSIRAVLEQAWRQLSEAERGTLRSLAVFQGGCARAAAEHVAGAALPTLTALLEKALLRLTHDGRYEIHELVRQFAEEQLRADAGQYEQARAQHSAYYTALVQQQTPELKGRRQSEAIAEIAADLANVRAAWQYAADHGDLPALERAAEGLWLFSDMRGAFQDGESAFQEAFARLADGGPPEEARSLAGFLLAGQGYLRYRRGDSKSGQALMEQGLALLRQAGQPADRRQAIVLLYLGWMATNHAEHERAQPLCQESQALFQAADDRWGVVAAWELWSRIAMLTRPLPDALQILQEGLALSAAIESPKLRGGFLHKLGGVAMLLGDYAQAQQWLEEALAIAQMLGALPGHTYVLRDLARLAVCQGRYAQAAKIVEECLAVAGAIAPEWTRRTVLLWLAEAHRMRGNHSEAERQYQLCLQAARASDSPASIAASLGGLGSLALARGELLQAEQLQLQALVLWRQLGQEPERASALSCLGQALAADPARAQEARQHCAEALQLAIKHSLAPIALAVFVSAARLYAGQPPRAVELLQVAEHHPASTAETRENARRQLSELPAAFSAAQARRAPDWAGQARQLLAELSGPSWERQSALPNNLAPQRTPFIGRAHELEEILRNLRAPACRLLTIVGPGGMGKTRLALQVAHQIVAEAPPAFSDGAFVVPLQPVHAAGGLISAIAEAAGFQFYADLPPRQQLFNFLCEKHMLLVLDSMEHLPEAADLVAELLDAAPGVRLLATSQRSLNLSGEWLHPLAGMEVPARADQVPHPGAAHADRAGDADAAKLFAHCARRARAGFAPEAEQEQVARICRLVDGMPLALELAAAWLKVLPCSQIADELERSLDILTTRHQDMPARHRSMRAVLEQSWQQLLDAAEQDVLKRLSVFRGGFTPDAARAVAGASLPALATLAEKALVWATPGGRYQMHELLRQFAQAQLAISPQHEGEVRARHASHYLELLGVRSAQLPNKARRAALDELGREIENVRLAWEWAAQQRDLGGLSRAVEPLYDFYRVQSRYLEGREAFSQAWAALQQADAGQAEGGDAALLAARVLARRAAFHHFLCEYGLASQELQECLARARASGQRCEAAFALHFLGQLAVWQGDQARARQHLLESLAISRELGDTSAAASTLEKLANLTYAAFGEYAESKQLAAQSLALSRQLGRPDWAAYALDTLGFISFCLGEYGEAEAHYRESLGLFEGADDQYGAAMALGGIGLVLWAIGGEKRAEAADAFQRSLQICRAIGHQGQVAGRLAGLARIANDLGDYAQAQQLAREALAIARELGSPVYMSHLLYCLGEAAYGSGDLIAARVALLEALRVTSETSLLADLAIALFHYAALLIRESDAEPGGAAHKQAQALELLALVRRHPATWHAYRERAGQLSAELEARVPAGTAAAARERAAHRSLEEAVRLVSARSAERSA